MQALKKEVTKIDLKDQLDKYVKLRENHINDIQSFLDIEREAKKAVERLNSEIPKLNQEIYELEKSLSDVIKPEIIRSYSEYIQDDYYCKIEWDDKKITIDFKENSKRRFVKLWLNKISKQNELGFTISMKNKDRDWFLDYKGEVKEITENKIVIEK